jgi:hypothetical protein
MRITIETENGDGTKSIGISDMPGAEDVDHALEVFSAALVAAGFTSYNFVIEEEHKKINR